MQRSLLSESATVCWLQGTRWEKINKILSVISNLILSQVVDIYKGGLNKFWYSLIHFQFTSHYQVVDIYENNSQFWGTVYNVVMKEEKLVE